MPEAIQGPMLGRGGDALDRAYGFLDRHAPGAVAGALRRLRRPGLWWLRVPLGFVMIGLSALWFLPVVGVEFLPLGVLLLAEDVPSLRGPVGRAVLRLELEYLRLRRRWERLTRPGRERVWPFGRRAAT